MELESLKSKRVLYHFEQINKIPRGSGNEKGISDYLVSFANSLGLEVIQDKALNVIIKKPATKGYENAPVVIIQGHMDMVCEKNADVVHDFEKDAIKVIYEGDFIHADGTTLGADDGIAVAMAMALLENNEVAHPALEVVITTDEEVGMFGASAIDCSVLKGKILLNVDSEDEGIFTVGCAGGMKTTTTIPITYTKNERDKSYKLFIKGLKGGHSGIDISKERANANKLLARFLTELGKKVDFELGYIEGGAKDNAIPREAMVEFSINSSATDLLFEEVEKISKIICKEYISNDPKIDISICETEPLKKVFDNNSKQKVINSINLIPNGVLTMNIELNLPESSNNIGVVRTTESGVEITCAIRSSVINRKYYIYDIIKGLSDLIGGNTIYRGNYPAWEFKQNSYIRKLFVDVYKDMFDVEPAVEIIHAGLECGLFGEKIEDVDMISFGPNIIDIHTPDERASISSIERQWDFFLKILSEIKE